MNVGVKAFLPGFEEAVMLARLRFDGRRLPGAIRAERAWRARQSNPGSRGAVLRRRESTRFSSASDDEVGGFRARSAPSELGE